MGTIVQFSQGSLLIMSRPNPAPNGVEWPLAGDNTRATTQTNQKVFSVATKGIDAAAADKMLKERGWRHKYDRHVLSHVKASLKSPEAAEKAARDGLQELHSSFEFHRDGKVRTVADAMGHFQDSLHTGVIKGTGSRKEFELPYHGKTLRGKEIVELANEWAAKGVLEPDAAQSIIGMATNPDWSNLQDKVFVLMGAGAAMGPFLTLMAMGANVVAIDIDIPAVWERLLTVAQSSAGSFTFPLKKPQSECSTHKELAANAGGNLISHCPEIANWVSSLYPEKKLVLGSYVYLDSAMFVKVSVACDAIIQKVLSKRPTTALAMLGTPTDVYVVPENARRTAMANYSLREPSNWPLLPLRLLAPIFKAVARVEMLAPNFGRAIEAADGNRFYVCEGITVPQGPNYILSKRMQQWRCIVARANGHTVSFNVAPSTRTVSVVKNKTFAWAYDGMGYFPAVEIFDQETSNPVMTALLLADLADPNSAANPKTPLRNPLELFAKNALHGGAWRTPYRFNTIGHVSVLIHFIKEGKWLILLVLLVLFYFSFLR